MNEERLQEILSCFSEKRVLVVGDFYLDAYWLVDQKKSTLSLETPWYTSPVVEQHYSPGAAGTVTNNLKSLGVGEVYAIGIIGQDNFGTTLLESLESNGCSTKFMIQTDERVTPTYLKPIYCGQDGIQTEGSRFDIENHAETPDLLQNLLITNLRQCLQTVDAVIIVDQTTTDNVGGITDFVREHLCYLSIQMPEKFFLADSRSRIGKYRNVMIKPNQFEAKYAIDPKWSGESVSLDESKKAGQKLHKQTSAPVIVTCGQEGILTFDESNINHVPGIPLQCQTDTVGAGDSVSAGLVSTLASGGNLTEAALVGNLVASVTVTKIGTTGTASPAELVERLSSLPS